MRMGFFFSEVFWGGLLILLGISAILRSFNVNIPIFRIAIALIIIYIGLSILLGQGFVYNRDESTIIFSESRINVRDTNDREFNTIFGKGVIDLSGMKVEGYETLKVNTIFGASEVYVPQDMAVRIKASSAFGNARMPNGNNVVFGDISYQNNTEGTENVLIIDASVVFGSVEIRRR